MEKTNNVTTGLSTDEWEFYEEVVCDFLMTMGYLKLMGNSGFFIDYHMAGGFVERMIHLL